MITIKKILPIIVLALTLVMCNTTPKKVEEKFTVKRSSPQVPIGYIETQINRAFPLTGIRKINVEVTYFPFEDAVCLNYRSDYFAYYQFWSRSGREAFLKAFEKYNADYDERNLDMRNKTSTKKYDKVEGYLIWQMFSITRSAAANMDVELGYGFNERFPYYTVTQKLTTYIDSISDENNMSSQEIMMYFTRAQAQELVSYFNQEFLRSQIPSELGGYIKAIETDIGIDEY